MKISSTLMPHNGIFLKRGVISYDDNIAPCIKVSKPQWSFDVKIFGSRYSSSGLYYDVTILH